MSSERLVGYTEVCQIFALAGIVSVSTVIRPEPKITATDAPKLPKEQ